MKFTQNQLEHLQDLLHRGVITADQANVEGVRMVRVHLVTARIPAKTRKALNAAVKAGELKHFKKDGSKPEAYFHPSFEHLAISQRSEHERNVNTALMNTLG